MTNEDKYQSIRPLRGQEIPQAIAQLAQTPSIRQAYEALGMRISWEALVASLEGCDSTEEFRRRVGYHLVMHVVRSTTQGLTLSGQEHIDQTRGYTYISNHRDIILDSAFLNVVLHDAGALLPQIAIGDNLMVAPWIETLVKLNGSFLVRRSLVGREVLLAARQLSEYMHQTARDGRSMWIAQREGRSKDSTDRTQVALLKMLAIGGDGRELRSALEGLSIVPTTCSYEYDPCDYLKAREMQLKRDVDSYSKTKADDAFSMRTGIFGYKGRVHIHLGRPLSELIQSVDWHNIPQSEQGERIARLMDQEIHKGYRLYPCNHAALHLLGWKGGETNASVSPEEITAFETYLTKQIAKIELIDGVEPDVPFLRQCLLEMYANPAINYYKQKEVE